MVKYIIVLMLLATGPAFAQVGPGSTPGGAVTLPITPSIANGSGVVPTQGGTALSATNGGYSNLLQGNAALSTTNPLPAAFVGPITVQVAQTVTASAYTAGFSVGGLMTIANAAAVSASVGTAGTGGVVQNIAMNSKSAQTTQVDVFLFDANPSGTTCTDHTAFVLASADFNKVIGVAHVTDWIAGNTASAGQAVNLALGYDLASSTSIYACAVTRATPTFASTSDISFKFNMVRY